MPVISINPSYGDDNSRLEGTGIICHQIDFERSPFKRKNITAYRQLKKLMEEHEFDLVHCHTPMGGALAVWQHIIPIQVR